VCDESGVVNEDKDIVVGNFVSLSFFICWDGKEDEKHTVEEEEETDNGMVFEFKFFPIKLSCILPSNEISALKNG
jgi:hypothetical protein